MNQQDETLHAIMTSVRDQARESVASFIKSHFKPDGDPDDALLGLLDSFGQASHGKDDTTAIWGILAGYGTMTAILEYLEGRS